MVKLTPTETQDPTSVGCDGPYTPPSLLSLHVRIPPLMSLVCLPPSDFVFCPFSPSPPPVHSFSLPPPVPPSSQALTAHALEPHSGSKPPPPPCHTSPDPPTTVSTPCHDKVLACIMSPPAISFLQRFLIFSKLLSLPHSPSTMNSIHGGFPWRFGIL